MAEMYVYFQEKTGGVCVGGGIQTSSQRMTLGDKREWARLDNWQVKSVSVYRRGEGMRNVSEGISSSFLRSKRKKEILSYQSYKSLLR